MTDLQRHEDVGYTPLLPIARGGPVDEARQHGRHLHEGEQFLAVVRPLQQDAQVERLVQQVRERVDRVYGQRRQDREDLAQEDPVEVAPVGLGQVLQAANVDAFALQGRQHLVGQGGVLGGDRAGGTPR